MNKLIKFGFTVSIFYLISVIPVLVIGFIKGAVVLSIIIGCVLFIGGIILFKMTYPDFLIQNRKSERWCKPLSIEELEIVEEVKELIKKVDPDIVISEFNVYKVSFLMHGWFSYDEVTQELNIFIPFKFFSWLGGKKLCFLAVLHEVLHSQNLKNNIRVFNRAFLEGLNQLLTIWLIENYSEKYSISENKKFSLRITKKISIIIKMSAFENIIYQDEVRMVRDILEEAAIDFKEVFINYINFQPEFFREFVPTMYFEYQ